MMKYTLLILGILLLGLNSLSQEVAATAQKNVQVGEQFFVKFEIEVPKGITVDYIPNQVLVNAIRTDRTSGKRDTVELEVTGFFLEERERIQGKEYWIGTYTLTSFDDGLMVIPPFEFKVAEQTRMSNPVMIFVDLMPVDKKVDLHDIEENFIDIRVPFFEKYEDEIWWIILAAVVGILVLLYFLFVKKFKLEKEEKVIELSTNDRRNEALDHLTLLMEKELWSKDQLKQHFSELSLIVRRYISKELGNSYLEKTSFEIQLLLRKKGYRESLIRPLGLILNVSDMVKFAKSSVEKDGIFKVYKEAKSFIEEFEKK